MDVEASEKAVGGMLGDLKHDNDDWCQQLAVLVNNRMPNVGTNYPIFIFHIHLLGLPMFFLFNIFSHWNLKMSTYCILINLK